MNAFTGRRAGILLAISSLPQGPKPQGALGEEAYRFVDFLADAGQSFWQILPIGPVGRTLSPYQTRSAFAGNPLWIDKTTTLEFGKAYDDFLRENSTWLDDYALFEAVRASQNGNSLGSWPDELKNPRAKTLAALRLKYKEEIIEVLHQQFCFFKQWRELKRYANLKGIGIIGDLPIYINEDSAEFWLRRRLFEVDGDGAPASSAGVPPDSFSKDGQIWNNPVYNWAGHKKELFSFWRERLIHAAFLYDGIRIDHFRAFADYYSVPLISSPPTKPLQKTPSQPQEEPPPQASGTWRPGPGKAFIDMIHKEFPGLYVVAEDLGELSKPAVDLVAYSGFPSMKVLQFAFSGDSKNPYLPQNITQNSICFTGTHDNNTLRGWLNSSTAKERQYAMEYLGISQKDALPQALLSAALACRSNTVIIPLQDWLGLGSTARMNKPGTTSNRNWKWKCPKDALTKSLAQEIRHKTQDLYNR